MARARLLALVVLPAAVALLAAPQAAHADACTPPVVNEVACENTKPGVDNWQIDGTGDLSMQGFATSMSVNKGETISFKIKSETPDYRISILRLGYYGGKGARAIATNLAPTGPSTQPECQTDSSSGLIDCGNWSVSRSWTVPSTAVSGVYIANLERNDTGEASQIPFVVRDDASDSDIVVQTSDQTWQAYNTYGGNSLYTCATVCPPGSPKAYKAAFKVSYNRPLLTEADSPGSALFRGSEYSMIRFLEQSGYDVSYVSGVDTHRRGHLLANHRLFISSGHDEYWSGMQRANVEAARDAGVNLAFFSGNLMFWKTRFEPSADGTNTPDRTLVSYKDTHFDAATDPVEWTGTWRDSRFTTDADGVTPENALTGTSFLVNAGTSDITVPADFRRLRMWRNTAVAGLSSGQSLTLAPSTLGYEWDVDADNGFRPAGQFQLSSTTVSGLDVFTDYGSTIKSNGTATHNLVMHRAPSGARVFSAGTVQWAWGLSNWNEGGNPANLNMQQATVNLFADMGAQPYQLLPGLVTASPSSDTTAPTSTIATLPASVEDGAEVTITGTAADAGGGVVAGVEVSTDGGRTWHPADGTTNWSYTWVAHGNPSATIKARAVDDSANLETPGPGVSVDVACPCSLFAPSVTPDQPDAGDTSPIEVGVKFRSEAFGKITGIRFYKSAANTGTHKGSLWTADGQRLAQATFTGETASGWQSVTFDSPVEILPDTTYVASYHAPNGRYAASPEYFYRTPAPGPNGGAIADSPPLHVVRNSGSTGNGVYSYGAASSFPTGSFGAANYWVDVMFEPIGPPGAVTDVTATEGGRTSANVSWSAPTSGGKVTSYKITPYVGSTAQTPIPTTGSATNATVSGLTTGTTYTFRVQAVNPAGPGPMSAESNPVTPRTAVAPSVPRDVTAQAASESARVTWSAPESDGDSAITGYTVTPYVGSEAQTPVQLEASARSTAISGLENGTSYTFRVRASNEVGPSPAGTSAAVTPQATIFDFESPAVDDSGDESPVELGVKFRADHDGFVTGVRFYKSALNTGTHVGSLWTAGGERLAQATFTGESASGWQTVTFAEPVPIAAGTTYVASYFTPSGHYAYTHKGFVSSGVDNPPLHALSNDASQNGVYAYSASSTFPGNTWQAANYWVDVTYALPEPGQVSGVSAAAGRRSAEVSWSAPSSGGPVSSYRIIPYVGSAAQTPTTVAGSATSATVTGLTAGTAYRFAVRAVNVNGPGPESALSNEVTPLDAVVPPAPADVAARPASSSVLVTWSDPAEYSGSDLTGHTVTPYVGSAAQTPVQVGGSARSATISGLENGRSYTFKVTATSEMGESPAATSNAATPRATIFDFATPSVVDGGDSGSVELGVKFRAETGGLVTGVRFYKSAANTGTHVGSLWSAGGERLAQATFTNETESGWQTVTFAEPVEITADTTYVASYFAPNGRYSITGSAFSTGSVDNPPLQALATGVSENGVYRYGGASSFPSNSFNAANYWVDVLFAPHAPPGQPTDVSATAGRNSAQVSWAAPASGGPPSSYRITPYLGSAAQTPTTVAAPATSATVRDLTAGSTYTFTVQAVNANGSGPESAPSNPVTPEGAEPPPAPTEVVARPASNSALVTWTDPDNQSGSDLTAHTVTPYVGSEAQTPLQVGGSAQSATVPGLENGTEYTFRVTATSDAGESAAATSNAVTPRATIFDFGTPATIDAGDPSSVVLGVKFRAEFDGVVTGLRFYKAAANTGTHVGSLWTMGGQLMKQATFADETASGWQTVIFDDPVPIAAGTRYVAAYLAPNGHYSVTGAAFASNPVANPPLEALASGDSPNGVYRYSTTPEFPSNSFNSTNYWVDVLFAEGS